MTNAPENYDSYILPDGVDKYVESPQYLLESDRILILYLRLEYIPDSKLPNAGSFKIEREDHTLGNMLRMQIIHDDRVIFVGYRQPHPLQHHIMLRVQTVKTTSPKQVLADAIDALQSELTVYLGNVELANPAGWDPKELRNAPN